MLMEEVNLEIDRQRLAKEPLVQISFGLLIVYNNVFVCDVSNDPIQGFYS